MNIQDIINNPKFIHFKEIFKLPKDEMYKLASHPSASVRFAAASHANEKDLPLFIADIDPDVIKRVRKRLSE